MHPDRVEGLMLINCTASQAGWVEWGYQKVINSNCPCCCVSILLDQLWSAS